MPNFRCTSCGAQLESPVVIGGGDCPKCGGDVVFDLRRDSQAEPVAPASERPGTRRAWFRRLLRRR